MRWALVFLFLLFTIPVPSASAQTEEQVDHAAVRFSEISLPAYDGDTGWIELTFNGDKRVDLAGWSIISNTGDGLLLDFVISPEQYLVIAWKEISTQTSHVILRDPLGNNVDQIQFSMEGNTFALSEHGFVKTDSPTPGRANLFLIPAPLACPVEDEIPPSLPPQASPAPEPVIETAMLLINELFANPAGDEAGQEFIELFNPTSKPVSLHMWKLADASKTYTLKDTIIPANAHLVLPRTQTGIALNNTNEQVRLIDPFDTVIDEVSYEKSTEGLSLNRDDAGWYEAAPTGGTINSQRPAPDFDDNQQESAEEEEEKEAAAEEESPEIIPSEIEQAEETTVPPLGLIINELLPNPVGSDTQEWIELLNTSQEILALKGVTIADEKTSYALPSGSLEPGAFLLLHRSDTKISLNNDADTLTLSYEQEVLDQVEYEESNEGLSWSTSADGIWFEAVPTPGEPNAQAAAALTTHSTDEGKSFAVKAGASAIASISMNDWPSIDPKTAVTIEGVITVAPGTFAARSARIQSTDTFMNVELYFHKALWPELEPGSIIRVSGEKSVTQTTERLLIRSADDIVFLDQLQHFSYEPASLKEISDLPNGTLILVNGLLIEQAKDQLLLEVFGEEMSVDLKKAKLSLAQFKEESAITVSGLLDRDGSGLQIIPRSAHDIVGDAYVLEAVTTVAPDLDTGQSESAPATIPWLIGSAAAAFAGKKYVFQALRPLLQSITNRFLV